MPKASLRSKPKKPYPNFSLTPHPNGQWCKKIRGQVRFFGIWSDPDAAHERYLKQAADLHAGREPTVLTGELTVKELADQYLNHKANKLASGEIGARWFEDCRRILKDFAEVVGKTRAVADLRPPDFQTYRARLTRRLGVQALTCTITVVKGMFKYATGTGLMKQAPQMEHVFRKPTATQVRKSKQAAELKNGKKLFTPDQVRQIIEAGLLPRI